MSLESITNEAFEAATEGFGTAEQRAETANAAQIAAQKAAEAKALAAQQAENEAKTERLLATILDIVKPDLTDPTARSIIEDLIGTLPQELLPAPQPVVPSPPTLAETIKEQQANTKAGLGLSQNEDVISKDLIDMTSILDEKPQSPEPIVSTPTLSVPDPDLSYDPRADWQTPTQTVPTPTPLSSLYEAYPGQFTGGPPGRDIGTVPSLAPPPDDYGDFRYDLWDMSRYGLGPRTPEDNLDYWTDKPWGPADRQVNRLDPRSWADELWGRDWGVGSLLNPIKSAILNSIDESRRTTDSRVFDHEFPVEETWDRGLNPDLWESGGNVEAIRSFLQDPTYGNIPEIDPVSALAAYQNAIGGIDALVGERGFTDGGYAQAARDRAQGIFDKFEAGQDFDSMLNEKIGRAFADEALFNKDIELRGQGVQAVEQSFPQGFASDIFDPDAFSKAAENIYGQKLQGAQDIIARAGSRGQLSPTGGRLASESLLSQGPDVQSRLSDILGGVRSEAEGGFGGIRGSALEAAQGYKLGDELFDITPFESQASDYLSTTVGELPGRITSAVGTDPLFSAVSALQEGGRQQGQVSGTPSFLDVLAEREGGVGAGRDRRGLGSRGSGVF